MWYNTGSTIASQNSNCGKMTTNIAPFFSSVEPMDVRDPKTHHCWHRKIALKAAQLQFHI